VHELWCIMLSIWLHLLQNTFRTITPQAQS
jgi:hypothetical protein